jgi:hypothetical protein
MMLKSDKNGGDMEILHPFNSEKAGYSNSVKIKRGRCIGLGEGVFYPLKHPLTRTGGFDIQVS